MAPATPKPSSAKRFLSARASSPSPIPTTPLPATAATKKAAPPIKPSLNSSAAPAPNSIPASSQPSSAPCASSPTPSSKSPPSSPAPPNPSPVSLLVRHLLLLAQPFLAVLLDFSHTFRARLQRRAIY